MQLARPERSRRVAYCPMKLLSHGRTLHLNGRPRIVAILNATPDSYYDGGIYSDDSVLADRAVRCIEEGADILEIGGESTGPGSKDVSLDDELTRVIPAVDAVRSRLPDAWIAVDTWKAELARQAIARGADMINDVTAGRGDPQMFPVIAGAGCPYVMMYSKDSSARTTVAPVQYDDVIGTIHAFLEERVHVAEAAGIHRSQIIVDPGLGHFVSSDPQYSFRILHSLRSFTDLGPVLVSPSRKSFLAGPRHLPPKDRLPATLEASSIAVKNGAAFVRTHDVKEMREVLDCVGDYQ